MPHNFYSNITRYNRGENDDPYADQLPTLPMTRTRSANMGYDPIAADRAVFEATAQATGSREKALQALENRIFRSDIERESGMTLPGFNVFQPAQGQIPPNVFDMIAKSRLQKGQVAEAQAKAQGDLVEQLRREFVVRAEHDRQRTMIQAEDQARNVRERGEELEREERGRQTWMKQQEFLRRGQKPQLDLIRFQAEMSLDLDEPGWRGEGMQGDKEKAEERLGSRMAELMGTGPSVQQKGQQAVTGWKVTRVK